MSIVDSVIAKAEQLCHKSGSRLTEKRKVALALLVKSNKALSAYELVDAYQAETGETMPAMSMYRILEFLTHKQLVHKLALANKYVACEHIQCEHDHSEAQFLICSQCQKVKEFNFSPLFMDELKKNIGYMGFHLSSPQIEINCLCEDCRERTDTHMNHKEEHNCPEIRPK